MSKLGIIFLLLCCFQYNVLCAKGDIYSDYLDIEYDHFQEWYDYKDLLHPVCLTVEGKFLQYMQAVNYTKEQIVEALMTCDVNTRYTTWWTSITRKKYGNRDIDIQGSNNICYLFCKAKNKTYIESNQSKNQFGNASSCTCTNNCCVTNCPEDEGGCIQEIFIGHEAVILAYCKKQKKKCCKTSDGVECSNVPLGPNDDPNICLPECPNQN